MDIAKAKTICADVAEQSARWGKHAGFCQYHLNEIQEALIVMHSAGLFELEGEHEQRVAANRAKGAAEARAKRSLDKQKELERKVKSLEKKVKELSEKEA